MKKFLIGLGMTLGILLLCAGVFFYLALFVGFYAAAEKPMGEYTGPASLQFLPDEDCYQIAVNQYGQPIFTDPAGAFSLAEEDYGDAVELLYETFKEEYRLKPFSPKNYDIYEALGWQLPTDDEALSKQGYDLTCFLDIYENSGKRWFLTEMGWVLA